MATGITENDVWTAADALLLEGARPTIERVRQKIGRGSPNTVSPHLETWFRALGARIKDPGAFAAPPAIPDPITQAATHFWEAALAEARAEQAEAYRERWQELADDGERLATQAEQLQLREQQLAKRESDLQEGLRVATAQLAATEERLQAAERQLRQRDDQLKQTRGQLQDAQSAVQTLLIEAEKMRGAHAQALEALESRHAAHERRWLNELDAERGAAKKLQARLDEAQLAAQKQVEQSQASLREAQDAKRAAEKAAQEARAEILAAQTRHAAMQAAETSARDALASAQSTLTSSRQNEQALLARLAAADAQAATLLAQLQQKDEQLNALTRHLMTAAMGAGEGNAAGT
ncbi:DNA-binding protein [Achromobacter piechaudii]|uniref:KfrA N-terminal DNA-binding domain-containing protein n=1 Tax=Achromobacter piechaudii TaxID=72556 RepID=A0A6S7DPA0_9BURK|nr:DNA-binding protein [Achromobacter piechaudii]CAB3869503.1 hypothetical protein LMG1861_02687 [Achromobacter piechaudii]